MRPDVLEEFLDVLRFHGDDGNVGEPDRLVVVVARPEGMFSLQVGAAGFRDVGDDEGVRRDKLGFDETGGDDLPHVPPAEDGDFLPFQHGTGSSFSLALVAWIE